MDLFKLLVLAAIGSVISLCGGLILLSNRKVAAKVAIYSAPFAAGALIGAVFFDLLPEAVEHTENIKSVFIWSVVGIIGFFLLERRLRWFHHHHEHSHEKKEMTRIPTLLIAGDTIHNAIDGAAIAFAYLADPALGIVTTLAVAFHEIPQEIGDFGLLLKLGWPRKKVLLANFLSALATIVMAVLVYFVGSRFESMTEPALALTAGVLLYIALSDVIPMVHDQKPSYKWVDGATLLIISGVLIVYGAVSLVHNFVH